MRIIHLILLLTAFIAFSCMDSSVNNQIADENDYQLLKLPAKSELSAETEFSVTKNINGDEGGSIILFSTYKNAQGKWVVITAYLYVPAGAFSGSENITLKVDDDFAAVSCSPGMVFNKSLDLSLTFSGINLLEMGINNQNADFAYISNDGSLEYLEYSDLTVNTNWGIISVKNAKLNHFSRFGFIKKS